MTRNYHSPAEDPNMDLSDVLRKMHSFGLALDCIGGPKTAPYGKAISNLVSKAYDKVCWDERITNEPPRKEYLLISEIVNCRDFFMTGSDSWKVMDKLLQKQLPLYVAEPTVHDILQEVQPLVTALSGIQNATTKPYAKSLGALLDRGLELSSPDSLETQQRANIRIAKTTEFCRDQFKEDTVNWKHLNEKREALLESECEFAVSTTRSHKP